MINIFLLSQTVTAWTTQISMLMGKMHILQLLSACYKPVPFVWLGAKPAWYLWDHVVRKHWLGLKPSKPLNMADFVNFEDCKQDFVAKFWFESPCSSSFSCIRKNFFFHPSPELQSTSLPVSWTLTGTISAGNRIMICKMNPLSSHLWLETDMPLLNFCRLLTVFLFNLYPWELFLNYL